MLGGIKLAVRAYILMPLSFLVLSLAKTKLTNITLKKIKLGN